MLRPTPGAPGGSTHAIPEKSYSSVTVKLLIKVPPWARAKLLYSGVTLNQACGVAVTVTRYAV